MEPVREIALSPEQLIAMALLISDYRRIVVGEQNGEGTILVRIDGKSHLITHKGEVTTYR